MPFLEEGACLILWPWVGTFSGRAFNRVCVFIQGNTIFSSPSPSLPLHLCILAILVTTCHHSVLLHKKIELKVYYLY